MTVTSSGSLHSAASYVDRWLGYQQQFRDLPGLVAGISQGEELLVSVHGFADLERQEPMKADHIYERDENGKALRVIIGGVSSWAEEVWRERTVTSQ